VHLGRPLSPVFAFLRPLSRHSMPV
jgi:hypothetical protein